MFSMLVMHGILATITWTPCAALFRPDASLRSIPAPQMSRLASMWPAAGVRPQCSLPHACKRFHNWCTYGSLAHARLSTVRKRCPELQCLVPATPHSADEKGRSEDVQCSKPKGASRVGIGHSIKLRRGIEMPQLGLGTGTPGKWKELGTTEQEGHARLIRAVVAALKNGYRLIDTALFSHSETDIATGIRMSGIDRSEIFVATKLLQSAHVHDDAVRASLMGSLHNLDATYVDLYMIHNPRAGRIKQVWPALLDLRDQGLIRVLGVSNFGVEQLEGMRSAGLELPEVNQVEVHCWRQMPELVEYHRKHGIVTMCMAPLARGEMFNQTDLAQIADELKQPEAAVAIRWSLQRGYIPIPRSVRPERIASNAAEEFHLSDDQMARIARLDSGHVACRTASPCSKLPWSLIADTVPDQALWDDSKKRKADAAARKAQKKHERAQKALARQAEQLRARTLVAAERRKAAGIGG